MKVTKKKIAAAILILPVLMSLMTKNPEGTSIEGEYHHVTDIEFYYDLTYQKDGVTVREQSILQQELAMIAEAKEFILLDLFLYNDAYDKKAAAYPNAVEQIAEALIAKKAAQPEMDIIFITDPMNEFYGAYKEKHLERMRDNKIAVITTDLKELKDSNFLYSGYYRTFLQWFGTGGPTWIRNPFDPEGPKINVRSALKLANFKANHRKLLVTEQAGLVTSANPHDASGYHSNVAIKVSSPVVQDMIEAERTVAAFSGTDLPELTFKGTEAKVLPGIKARYLTEKGVYNGLMQYINEAKQGDTIHIGIFYISDFDLVKGLEEAAERGAQVKIVADPNKDAFGIKKDGSPNRSVLSALREKSDNIEIRWYDTHGEQYHTKMAYFTLPEQDVIILGSGNYTRRNLKGYNLENDLEVVTEKNSQLSREVAAYFDRIWSNIDGDYTLDFAAYEQDSAVKWVQYLVQESTGLSTY